MAVRRITPALFIRQHILGMGTTEFAEALGVTMGMVSRYDLTGAIPEKHHGKVKKLAAARKVRIRSEWFRAVPWAPGVPE